MASFKFRKINPQVSNYEGKSFDFSHFLFYFVVERLRRWFSGTLILWLFWDILRFGSWMGLSWVRFSFMFIGWLLLFELVFGCPMKIFECLSFLDLDCDRFSFAKTVKDFSCMEMPAKSFNKGFDIVQGMKMNNDLLIVLGLLNFMRNGIKLISERIFKIVNKLEIRIFINVSNDKTVLNDFFWTLLFGNNLSGRGLFALFGRRWFWRHSHWWFVGFWWIGCCYFREILWFCFELFRRAWLSLLWRLFFLWLSDLWVLLNFSLVFSRQIFHKHIFWFYVLFSIGWQWRFSIFLFGFVICFIGGLWRKRTLKRTFNLSLSLIFVNLFLNINRLVSALLLVS